MSLLGMVSGPILNYMYRIIYINQCHYLTYFMFNLCLISEKYFFFILSIIFKYTYKTELIYLKLNIECVYYIFIYFWKERDDFKICPFEKEILLKKIIYT